MIYIFFSCTLVGFKLLRRWSRVKSFTKMEMSIMDSFKMGKCQGMASIDLKTDHFMKVNFKIINFRAEESWWTSLMI
jgi:hypothetical protein